ncbi:TlyA family RNA methyltransferase [Bacillus tianshenii]|nr:TlyA family RNA methyltransferase [Bacillus tianshenii]
MAGKKERIDILLVEQGFFETREKAKRSIMAGIVFADGQRVDKPGVKVKDEVAIEIKGRVLPYVGRGGLKLEKALKVFDLTMKEKTVIDIGASTGGFTDCALQNGASRVYALDVGYNQLAWKLRQDERVVVMERTNFRYVTLDDLTEGQPNSATIDVSFISLRLILPVLKELLQEDSDVVTLVKPQFEAGRDEVGKKGIVRDKAVHERVLTEIGDFAQGLGYSIMDASYSPITGGDGNIEFLLHLCWKPSEKRSMKAFIPSQIVQEAHDNLKKTNGAGNS